MNNNRFCKQKGHEMVKATYLCTFKGCKLMQCQCCIQCINEGIHNHGQADQKHIRIQQEIQQDQQRLPQYESHRQQIQCMRVSIIMANMIASTLDQNKKSNKFNKGYLKLRFIDKIKPIDLSKREYKVKQIDEINVCLTAHISSNEKYFAYGDKSILKVYDIKEDRIIKQFKCGVSACQFSFDSSQFYAAFSKGRFQFVFVGFDVQKNFKKIFKCCMRQGRVYEILRIQNQCLITFNYNQIIKIDIKRNKQIFKLNFPGSKAIDYNQSYDMIIIGGYYNKYIELWGCSQRRIILNSKKMHSIQQLQFINNAQNFLSLGYGYNRKLYKWSVDLMNNQLIKLQKYQEPDGMIFSFCSINYHQNLLLICGDYVKIVDDKGQTINKIIPECKINSTLNPRQPDSAGYLHFENQTIFIIIKKVKLCWLKLWSDVK